MRLLRCGIAAAFLVLAGCGSASSWDPLASVPEPVTLPDGMDEKSPTALYQYGQQLLERNPARAADAFYWASRLDPTWADPLYARRMALLMAEPRMFNAYLRGSRHMVQSPGVLRLDSLYLRAIVMNPFLSRREDAPALRYLIVYDLTRGNSSRVDPVELNYALDNWMRQAGPVTRGWLAQSEGRLADAARHYEEAVGRGTSAEVLADLARVHFLLGRKFDARQNMAQAVDLLRSRDEDDELVRIYGSKAVFEHSLGMIIEEIGDRAEARQAYARALQEDLAFHPAHMRLAELALAEGDTLTALSEMGLAADVAGGDPGVHLRYARVLAATGRHDEAQAQYRLAIESEPLFAQPYFELADALEKAGRSEAAADEYRAFLERAARTDRSRGEAEQRLRALDGAASGGGGPDAPRP